MSKRLSSIVKVARRFSRAVRVDADLTDPRALDGYVCSQSAVEALLLMGRHHKASGHGAFTWTGPYGSGKSSLAIALAALAAGPEESRKRLLGDINAADREELIEAFRPTERAWRVVAAVGRRDAPETAIAESIAAAIQDQPKLARGERETLAAWALRIATDKSHAGLILLVDEMGKFLEHAARADGDVHLFQDLAETASRSEGRLMVVGILHQAFDEYAHRLAREARDEWIKIQGRYLDVPINLAAEEQLDLIGRAIEASRPGQARSAATSAVAKSLSSQRFGNASVLETRLEACWPLHPLVAALLGPISRRRFGQNQRSLFGFLNSVEPYGFQSFLEEAEIEGASAYHVGRLWDYLHANLEPAILASPDGHRWSTALEALARLESREASPEHFELLKAIALIDLFKDRSGLQASPDLLSEVVAGLSAKRFKAVLEDLTTWSVVIFRKHSASYAIFAGSDFDIDVAVDQAREAGVSMDLRQLSRYAALQPILAKRHYETTGALRWFEIELCAVADAEERIRTYQPAPGAAGLFLLAVSGEEESASEAQSILKRAKAQAGDRLVVPGWTPESFMIREMAFDLAALEHVRAHRAELAGDAVARREVDARITRLSADLEDRMASAIHRVKWERPAGMKADISLRHSGPAGLSILASRLADWRYPKAPHLPNELVNRSRPSSNAAGAVRTLLRAMIDRKSQARLGITGFPPEAGLYVSLLETTGLHRYDEATETWAFTAPAANDPHHLHGLWQATDNLLKSRNDGVSMAEVFKTWQAPDFGLRNGLCNILGAAYLLTRVETCAFYLDGVFRPSLDTFVIDRMVQEPSSVRIRAVQLSDVDFAFISTLSDRLSTEEAPIPPTTFDVARALVGLVRSLPMWSQRTGRLNASTIAFRDRAKTAEDPNRFLTVDTPKAFGWSGGDFSGPALARQVTEAVDELRNAYGLMLTSIGDNLMRELRVKSDGLAALRRRAASVKGVTGNFRLDALATRLSTYEGTLEELEGISSLAANKPPRDWVDRDIDAASVELAALAQQFLKAEIFQRLKGREGGRVAMAVYISDPDHPEPKAREITVSAAERAEAGVLAQRLRALVEANGASPEVALAALADLGWALSQEPEPEQKSKKKLEIQHG